jgi:hypothetical protein
MLASSSNIVSTALGCWISYISILAIYRLCFHPLAKFPGPKIAALTNAYEFYYDAIKGGMFLKQMEKMHEKYGKNNFPFVSLLLVKDLTLYYS